MAYEIKYRTLEMSMLNMEIKDFYEHVYKNVSILEVIPKSLASFKQRLDVSETYHKEEAPRKIQLLESGVKDGSVSQSDFEHVLNTMKNYQRPFDAANATYYAMYINYEEL